MTVPPQYGQTEEEPVYPDIDPDADLTHVDRARINVWINDQKNWSSEQLRLKNDKLTAFSTVHGQLSEASRAEVQDCEDWDSHFRSRDLLYLINRIRATHIAVQSGNLQQDQERVRAKWYNMKQAPDQDGYQFRREVENYQMERVAVGLAPVPESELVIGILNRLDQHRFGHVRTQFLENQRLNIGIFPERAEIVWKEVKDSQAVRYNSTVPRSNVHVYLSRTEENDVPYYDRSRVRGRGGRGTQKNHDRGKADHNNTKSGASIPTPKSFEHLGEATAGDTRSQASITPRSIICHNCGKKGHKKADCRSKKVFYSESREESAFFTTIAQFNPHDEKDTENEDHHVVVLSSSTISANTKLLLDTQASIHIIANKQLLENVEESDNTITVQGITRDVTQVTLIGTLKSIGIRVYYSPKVAANILSYAQLQHTHTCTFNNDIFTAVPKCNGPTLIFTNVNGHYTMDIEEVIEIYATHVTHNLMRYNQKQIRGAQRAYEFMERLGFISYKAAAEVIRRSSISNLGFTRADLVTCQDIYGRSAAYQLGHGTQRSVVPGEDDPIPIHESIDQELQVDTFFIFGQVFFLSISVVMGLIMTSHLGVHHASSNGEKAKSRSGHCLLEHIDAYEAHGFSIKRVTSDGEPAIKAVKLDVERLGIQMNILGHGSHAPHAESAIRHIKNKARSTAASLQYALPIRWSTALIAFVTHTINMVPRSNSPGHISAYTSFTGRVPDFRRHAPHPFGSAGFLQKASTPRSNSSDPRQDYCIWLGTTRNLAGTHQCFNIATLQMITGDIFRPAPLTPDAAVRISRLAGHKDPMVQPAPEPLLTNPSPRYPLDPDRGVLREHLDPRPHISSSDLDSRPLTPPADIVDPIDRVEEQLDPTVVELGAADTEDSTGEVAQIMLQVSNLVESREKAPRRHHPTHDIYVAMSIKQAIAKYGEKSVAAAGRTELLNCIEKGVWECLPSTYISIKPIPSKLFLTPKHTTTGEFKLLKGRIVGGGHRQDTTLFTDAEISSPTVALTSVMIGASVAAHLRHHVMTLDHTAAYLNAEMKGPDVEMMLNSEVSEMLCDLDNNYRRFVRPNGKIHVKLKKALYGCVQSAVLWYKELKSTLISIGFLENAYDICSFTRTRGTSIDRILVYVDDLFITSDSEAALDEIDKCLRDKYGGVTSKKGLIHEYLGIKWDFSVPGEVSLSMQGYIKDIFAKYNVHKLQKVPANSSLFTIGENSPELCKKKQEMYHSIVMTLHYLAKRVRPDLLTSVSWCASRVLKPTEEDENKIDRILGYLFATKEKNTVLRIGNNFQLRAYVDASYAVYQDAKSVTGMVLMLGDAVIYVKSAKQKIVTRSSTESELTAISDSLSQILWTREYILSAGLSVGPVLLLQDNMSTIFLANKGRSVIDCAYIVNC